MFSDAPWITCQHFSQILKKKLKNMTLMKTLLNFLKQLHRRVSIHCDGSLDRAIQRRNYSSMVHLVGTLNNYFIENSVTNGKKNN
jgi:hypothetical protein